MCGRFTLILEPSELQEDLNLGSMPAGLQPRYNVAPTQPIATVNDPATRAVELMRWGLIPSWAKDASIGSRLINARSETLVEKPSFRNAFAHRRCLVLADGFYEWFHPTGKTDKGQPYFFRLSEAEPFAFAGLWDLWRSPEGEAIQSCTIITCPANDLVGRYHERMPAILDASQIWRWMDPNAGLPALQTMLQPYPAEKMTAYPVSAKINNPAYDAPDCIASTLKLGQE
jgi:putative SOS response-associated peptidase YedK